VTSVRSRSGFSLIELAVSLVVIGLVLALAAELLGEAQLTFVTVARENRTSAPTVALQWLRQDLRAARSVGGGGAWVPSSGPLELLRGQGWIVYQLEGESLWRTAYDLSNLPGPSRPILGDLVSWSWRRPSTGLVEVTILQREPLARLLRVRADLGRPATETRVLRLTIAQRGQAVGW
jgi:prepilin-type N-terminal cleavage/methylation domain-containing protein